MTVVLLLGALSGLGVLVLLGVLVERRESGAVALGRLDLARNRRRTDALLRTGRDAESLRLRRMGSVVRDVLVARGLTLDGLRSDLAVDGRALEGHLARSLVYGVVGAVLPFVVAVVVGAVGGSGVALVVPMVGVLVGGALGVLLPTSQVKARAATRRADFRHTVGAFLDLVALNLAGGRGVPEALQAASHVGRGWALERIRAALEGARLQGTTPWAAMGELGRELGVEELVDLAAALALVAEDGAKVRESLAARAATLRRRELAELEGKAQERSQSMLVAQLLLCAGFLLFLIYPAIANVLASDAL